MADLSDVMRILGRLEQGQEQIRFDLQEEKTHAHESRAVIHSRLDQQFEKIARLETTVAISGEVDAQLRDQVVGLKETVESNHKEVSPAVEDWERMKALGIGISGLIGLAGLTIGGILAYAGDAAVTTVRHWLKLN